MRDVVLIILCVIGVAICCLGMWRALRPHRGQHCDRLDVTGPEAGQKNPEWADPASTVVDLPAFEAGPADPGWATSRPRRYAPPAREAAPLLAAPAPPEPILEEPPLPPLPPDVPPRDVPDPDDDPLPLDVPAGPPVPDEGGAAEVDFPLVFMPSPVLARAREMLDGAPQAELAEVAS